MLRSMIVGLAIAALLQLGDKAFSPVGEVTLAAQRIDWVKVQTEALERLIYLGYTLITR